MTKSHHLTSFAIALFLLSGCDAKSEDHAEIAEAPVSTAPQQQAPRIAALSSDEVLASYGEVILNLDGIMVPLRVFTQWAATKPDGATRWGLMERPGGPAVMLQLTYTYEDGSPADFGFIFGPMDKNIPQDMPYFTTLGGAYRGEQRLSEAEAFSVLYGITKDMYHQGMISFD